jgi:hypothetical protein
MSETQRKAGAGCLGGVLAGVFGVVVGFIVGFLPMGAFIPFSDPQSEARKWLPGIALLSGAGGAFVGGLLGIITGTIFGAKAVIRAAATTGVLVGLIGVVVGFICGFLLSGVVDRQWAFITEGSVNCAMLGGTLGIITGTILGARAATRVKGQRPAPEP